MYRRQYGRHRNHGRQSGWVERQRADRRCRYAPPSEGVFTYGLVRCKPRPHERDVDMWAERLEKKEKEELHAARKMAKEEEEKRRVEAARLAELKKAALLVEAVDLHVEANAQEHHTDLFDCTEDADDPQLVVRRGQEFKMTLTFQRAFKPEVDDMELIFQIGDEPNPRKGTHHVFKLREEGDDRTKYMRGKQRRWGARILSSNDEACSITVGVYPPPNCIIGEWEYSVRTIKGRRSEEYECAGPSDVIVLLNPWCPDDQVYYTGEQADLDEYIINQSGAVFNGSSRRVRSRPWNYGQFQQGVLEISLYLLRMSNNFNISHQLADPVHIARALSRILNDTDDNGVLSGRWDGEYSDGIKPTTWQGSAAILRKFWKQKSPVKYGQCWVFSHLLTTVSRALGLPCRSVTNFTSAHDTDLTMTIDKYVDDDGDEVEYKNSDSVWNFHVWNDIWVNRPDLDLAFGAGGKYDGWHAVDATPQEMSEGMFQCGPAPLRAIKEGDVHVGYDTKFIFGEVNAEYCSWKDGQPPTLLSKNAHHVGKKLSTKCPDGKKYQKYWGQDGVRHDVTHMYKYDEGTVAEREAVERATQQGKLGDHLFVDDTGVSIEVIDPPTDPMVGCDVTVTVRVRNSAPEPRAASLKATVRPAYYWGGLKGKEKILVKEFQQEEINSGEAKTYTVDVPAKDYLRLCDESLSMRVLLLCKVRGFHDPVFASDDFDVAPPEIDITEPNGDIQAGEEFEVVMKFENPLTDRKLTGCELTLDGNITPTGSEFTEKESEFVMAVGDLEPGEKKQLKVKVKASLKPRKSKERSLEVGLGSRELPDFTGSLSVTLAA